MTVGRGTMAGNPLVICDEFMEINRTDPSLERVARISPPALNVVATGGNAGNRYSAELCPSSQAKNGYTSNVRYGKVGRPYRNAIDMDIIVRSNAGIPFFAVTTQKG